jgi:hypothetical protein
MHFSKISIIAAATMASIVVADNCFEGFNYCSVNLNKQGPSPSSLFLFLFPSPLVSQYNKTKRLTIDFNRRLRGCHQRSNHRSRLSW